MNLLVRSGFIVVAVIVVVAAVLLMFSDSEDDSSVGPEQKPQRENTILPNDTLKDTTDKPDRPLSMSPGHARVEITITEIQDGKLTAEVHRVLGYGSSTKPVASGQQLNIAADTYLKNSSIDAEELEGKRLQATINIRQHLSLGESSGKPEWVLVKLDE